MDLIDVGYGSAVNTARVIAVAPADAAPTKRLISAAKERGLAVDATCGKKTASVFVMDSGHVILSAKSVESFTKQKTVNNGEFNGGS
jgi:regulator of extracellular matrix RemA (YlzA/DUF370 family)